MTESSEEVSSDEDVPTNVQSSNGEEIGTNADEVVPEAQSTEAEEEKKPSPVGYISSVLLLLFILGVYDFITQSYEPNQCAMTFMFEMPEYIKVQLSEETKRDFPHYNLYVYSEGSLVDNLKKGEFGGIPALFIPGNAGSYKQVRSIASVALRKAIDITKYKTHFDFFTIDFGEEMSAIYGPVLNEQSMFAARCIKEILNLYAKDASLDKDTESTSIPPSSVFVIGHSVGGMVAKSMYLLNDFDAHSVNTILTLATPHSPVLYTDGILQSFYSSVNVFWAAYRDTKLSHVTLVSIGGGVRDTQVRSDLIVHPTSNLSLISTSAQDVWVSADHLCIVWCKQLVMSINRILFDLINPNTGQLTFDKDFRQKVFNHHLVSRSSEKKEVKRHDDLQRIKTFEFDKEAEWIELIKRQFTYKRIQGKKWTQPTNDVYLMIKAYDDPKYEEVTIEAMDLKLNDWIFGCKVNHVHKNSRICESGENLSHLTTFLPSKNSRKSVRVNLSDLRKLYDFTHIIVIIPKSLVEVRVNVDVYSVSERHLSLQAPRWITYFLKKQVMVQRTSPEAIFYEVSITGFDQMWQAFTVTATPLEGKCRTKTHFGLIKFKTSLGLDDSQALIGHNLTNSLLARLSFPVHMSKDGNVPENYRANVSFNLNPGCVYELSIKPSIPSMWGQIVRIYSPMVFSFVVSATLLTLAQQIKTLAENKDETSSFNKVLTSKVSPMAAVMPCRLLAGILATTTVAQKIPFPTDFALVAESGLDFTLLPIILFFVAMGLVRLNATAVWYSIAFLGNVFYKLLPKRDLSGDDKESLASTIFKYLIGFALVLVSIFFCGGLALCAGTFVLLLRLSFLYRNYLAVEKSVSKEDEAENKRIEKSMQKVDVQFSMTLIWILTMLLNVPSLIAWSHFLQYKEYNLPSDPSQLTSVVLCLSFPWVWSVGFQNFQGPSTNKVSVFIQLLSVLSLLYCSIIMYRLNFIFIGVFVSMICHKVLNKISSGFESRNVLQQNEKKNQ